MGGGRCTGTHDSLSGPILKFLFFHPFQKQILYISCILQYTYQLVNFLSLFKFFRLTHEPTVLKNPCEKRRFRTLTILGSPCKNRPNHRNIKIFQFWVQKNNTSHPMPVVRNKLEKLYIKNI